MTDSVLTFPENVDSNSGADRGRSMSREERVGMLEAVLFAVKTPQTLDQLEAGLGLPKAQIYKDLCILDGNLRSPSRGLEIRVINNGFRMTTKPEHHQRVRNFVKSLRPKLRLSKAALETLAVVAYRQPVTLPEIQAIRGVTSASAVIHTLLRHKFIAVAGRKQVVGRPMLYKTTSQFLVHFGLKDLSEMPSLKELEELKRFALDDDAASGPAPSDHPDSAPVEPTPFSPE